MAIYALGKLEPVIDSSAFIHPDAVIIGDVHIGAQSTVWPGAVLRGDDAQIRVGSRTSIQDNAVLHVTDTAFTTVGNECVIGHLAHLEGCTIRDNALVGSGAVVLHEAIVESWALVGANAVVPGRKVVPSWAMALGTPAKIRENAVTRDAIMDGVGKYIRRVEPYTQGLKRLD